MWGELPRAWASDSPNASIQALLHRPREPRTGVRGGEIPAPARRTRSGRRFLTRSHAWTTGRMPTVLPLPVDARASAKSPRRVSPPAAGAVPARPEAAGGGGPAAESTASGVEPIAAMNRAWSKPGSRTSQWRSPGQRARDDAGSSVGAPEHENTSSASGPSLRVRTRTSTSWLQSTPAGLGPGVGSHDTPCGDRDRGGLSGRGRPPPQADERRGPQEHRPGRAHPCPAGEQAGDERGDREHAEDDDRSHGT